nr:uncharacterized protein LOC129161614 [Nothobranchius furzeri]
MPLKFYKNEILTGRSGVYILQKFLGKGNFGAVYKGLKQGTDEAVALKFMDRRDSAFGEVIILEHLRELQAHENALIKFIDNFVHNDRNCLVFEMLDMDLFDLMEIRQKKPLDVSEVRVVARDLLVGLNALKNAGVTHADIKPDNIMLVNHQSQPFRVKLIDFGLAIETYKLRRYDTIQVCGFRAPEVNLGLPLTEAIDMWAVACTLTYIFLGDHIHNTICEFKNMRQIFKLHGLPDQDLLGKGTKVDRFFIFDQSNQTWRFKTPQEYTERIIIDGDKHDVALDSIDDFLTIHPEIQDPFELEDLQAFVDLLKKMFTVNPSERITPEEALNHRFITMSHLPPTSNNSYVIWAYEKMKVYRMEKEEPSISPDFNVRQTADRKSDLSDFNPSDSDLSDSDLSELEDSDSDLSDFDSSDSDLSDFDSSDSDLSDFDSSDSDLSDFDSSDSDLSDLDTDEESNEPANTSDFQLLKIQDANLSDMKLHDPELEGSRRDRLDETSFELYKDQTITGESGVYIIQKFLGRVAFGQEVKGLKQGTDEVVALKFIHKDNSESATAEATILKHLKELQADQKNLIKLIDHFEFNDSLCLVFEMLDMDLFGLLKTREWEPLDVSEVRVVARDLLVALNALKIAGVTHADIKPDNIMLVNHQSQPFRVKLIDFGVAMETHKLWRCDTIQVCGFRAPEVNLGLPLTEAIDMWAVACTLAFIFLGDYIHNTICEFINMRQIFKLHGLPDQDLLGKGTKVDRFFIFDQSNQTWRFKTPQEYTETIMINADDYDIALDSIDDFLTIHPEIQDPFELEDLQAFVDLLKKMFTVNPSERITPEEALNHRFITMSHLPPTSNNSYVIWAYKKMKVYRMEKEEPSISPDFNVRQTADRKSDIFDFSPSDYDLSDSDLSELEDSDSGLFDSGLSDFDLSDSDLSDLDTDEESNEPANTSDFQLLKIQEANLSDMKLHDPELEGSRRDRLDETSFELYKDQTITGESGVYIIQKFLGRVAFGQVVKGLKQGTDEVVALKFIHKDNSESATAKATILKHLRELQADQKNLIKLIDHFEFNDSFCLVFEMLDMDLFDLMEMRQEKPLDVSEVRVVARDLLVGLNALKNAGVTHADIKPDNIMLVNHQSQPFRVKLIDFGVSMETHKLWRCDTIQVCGFRAPEVNLGLPLTEAVHMWAVACTLAFIFLGDYIHNTICEFINMRQIFKLHGLPDQDLLGKGKKVDRFFIFDQSNQTWRFKTPQEYTETIIIDGDDYDIALDSIDDFLTIHPEIQDPFELEDLQAFVDLLKKMFTVNPSERITPEEALNHRFITMSHLPPTSNNSYVIWAYEKMKVYRMEKEEPSISPDFNVRQTADRKSDLFDFNPSDYDLSDSDLSELEDSDSGLFDSGLSDFDLSDSDLSDLDTDEESNEPANTSDFQLLKIQEANLADMKLHDSELEGSRRDRLDETSFELYKDQTITGESGVYIIQSFLGRVAFGQVVKGLKQGTDEVVALKFIHKDNSESATAEATILKHLRELQADQKNLIKLIDHFELNDSFCLVFEMLDMDLFDLMEMRQEKPLDVSEVRVVARDLLVGLNALKNAGVTHADIRPDNIMLVNHQSQPFRVKLIDFGVAMETHQLWRYDTIQVCGFRAPEVNLGLPLTEAIDMWAVACTLAFIFLGDYIHNPICEFNNMRQIFKLHGLPDQDLLGKGTKVDRFFIFDQSNQTWRFKTPQEYTETIMIDSDDHDVALDSIDDFLTIHPEIQDPFELEDLQAFVDLLKKMFTVNPSERITPEEALNHRFITMSHLPPTSNNSYVIWAFEKRKVYIM